MTAAHVAVGVAALLVGLLVMVRPKGTAAHRRVGRVYVVALLAVAVTALLLYPSGGITPFHGVALVVAVQVLGGVAMARRRRPAWYVWHMRLMLYSYVVLVGTTLSQFWEVLPLPPALRALTFLVAPAVVAWAVIEYRTIPAWSRVLARRGDAAAADT